MKELTSRLEELSRQAEKGGGDARIEKQYSVGKLIARERVDLFLEKGSLIELNKLVTHRCTDFGMERQKISGDGVVTGYGVIGKRLVYIFVQDSTVFDGALSEMYAKKICKVMDTAMQMEAPIIGPNDSGGAHIQEGARSLAGYAEIFSRNSSASGVIPQISAIMGPCAGGTVYSLALTDFILMVRNSGYMFITGPDAVKSVTQEEVSKEDLGGADVHTMKLGVVHLSAGNDIEYTNYIRELISYLPGNNMEEPPFAATTDSPTWLMPELSELVPTNPDQPYDIKEVIHTVADDNSFLGSQEKFARNVVIGYIRLNGKTIGVMASQSLALAGTFDINASTKAARFVRFCDASNILLLTLVDVPGFLPGVDQEYGDIIRNGAKLLYAYCEATVPEAIVTIRKVYGSAYDVMSSKHIRGDVNLTHPTAETAVMGPGGAASILFRREIDKVADTKMKRKGLQDNYRGKSANPYRAAELDYADEVTDPAITRMRLICSLKMLANKRQSNPPKKHPNLPL